jgi:hypothetical protein
MVGQGSHAANRGFKLNGVKAEQGDIITNGQMVLRVGHTDYSRGKLIVRTTTLDGHKRSYVTFCAHRETYSWWVISEHSAWLYQK